MTRYSGLVLALSWSVAIAATVVLAPAQPALGVLAAAAAVPVIALAAVMRPALVAFALAAALLAVARVELPATDASASARAAGLVGATVVMTGRVSDDARAAGGGGEVLVEPAHVQVGLTPIGDIGNLLVRWRGPTRPEFGDTVAATGELTLPPNMPDFDRRAYLAQRRVYLELETTRFDVTESGRALNGIAAWLRSRYVAALNAAMPPPHAGVLLGIVLGIHQGIPKRMEDALIATGLVHLLVLSGLKVAVFARIVQAALAPILGHHAAWPTVGLIALYALVGGATPAAVRACAMGGLAIAAARMGRPTHVWTSLTMTAAAMLGWSPELAWDVGFQLSFAGTAAIVLLTPAIERRVRFLPHLVREPFAVTCAAQVGTVPMMATDFHVLSPIAPVANAVTLPILPVLVAAGFLLSALAPLPEVARIAAIPITGLLAYIEQVGFVLAKVPLAAIAIPSFPTWLGVAYYASLVPAIAGAHARGNPRKLAFFAAVAAPILISTAGLIGWANATPHAVVMDVGDGQAVLLRGPLGAVLIDGGPSPGRLDNELGLQLPPWQRDLDAMVVTAPGLGHVGGLAGFNRKAATLLLPGTVPAGTAWRKVALEQVARGASIKYGQAGERMRIAGFDLEVLAPEPGAPGDVAGAANLALRVVVPSGRSFCDLGDLDIDAQTVAASRLHGACSYVLLPGGGRSRLSPDLERAAVSASTQLIASRGPGRLAAGYPPNLLRTDEEGTITLPL